MQAAYAFADHWAVTTSDFHRKEKNVYGSNYNSIYDTSTVRYKRNLIDLGVGYFVSLNRKKTITFNLYAGAATGKFSINDYGLLDSSDYSRFHNSHITKWYFQPSFNFSPSGNFRLSYVVKSSYIHYNHIETSYTQDELEYFR